METGAQVSPYSSSARLAEHPAYQQIIALGPEIVPLLLRELERSPDHWFRALHALTGADPVPPESRGKLPEMAAAWLRWGREQGYQWVKWHVNESHLFTDLCGQAISSPIRSHSIRVVHNCRLLLNTLYTATTGCMVSSSLFSAPDMCGCGLRHGLSWQLVCKRCSPMLSFPLWISMPIRETNSICRGT